MSLNPTNGSPKVYVDYEYSTPPPHPGIDWTRFVCISDTHSRTFPVPDGDILLHSGDLSSWGYPHQIEFTLAWLRSLPHSQKIIIAGNHDQCLDASLTGENQVVPPKGSLTLAATRDMMRSCILTDSHIHYLEHESITLGAPSGRLWSFYGSPSAPKHVEGAFQYSTADEANAIYQRVPPETEVLLTHTPPYLILDQTKHGKNAGCPHLAERMRDLGRCRLHVFGHIHEAWGAKTFHYGPGTGEVVCANAALAHVGTRAIIVDLKN